MKTMSPVLSFNLVLPFVLSILDNAKNLLKLVTAKRIDKPDQIKSLSVKSYDFDNYDYILTGYFSLVDSKGKTFDGSMVIDPRKTAFMSCRTSPQIKITSVDFGSKNVIISKEAIQVLEDLLNQDYELQVKMMIDSL